MEGVVAKQASAKYTPEGTSWVKIKNRQYSQAVGREDLFSVSSSAVGRQMSIHYLVRRWGKVGNVLWSIKLLWPRVRGRGIVMEENAHRQALEAMWRERLVITRTRYEAARPLLRLPVSFSRRSPPRTATLPLTTRYGQNVVPWWNSSGWRQFFMTSCSIGRFPRRTRGCSQDGRNIHYLTIPALTRHCRC